ncbi:aminopeptidase N-like [Alosa sapidissima]|uniref:aminopeptidase N-like n=1 Tax=Alosa sapidissima TaxID=34773 RepID=UPI001C0817D3|nr:aminopeptidase N-like [Alosa sapidissima]XP_041930195.1 aminopeptidase N-like [Alosa sapidissima]XP_041930196.1 aminopeptidase N-like [Alosa sapidissima]
MSQGYYVSRTVAVSAAVVAVVAAITIFALSVAYSKHKCTAGGGGGDGGGDGGTLVGPTPAPEAREPWDRYRLPDTLYPVHYNVTLWPRLTKNEHGLYVFTGHSTVDFKCEKETDLILIHSSKLNLTKSSGHHATLTGLGRARAPSIKTTWLQEKTEYLVVQLSGKLVQGHSYQLHTKFQGELADDLEGFYRSEYTEKGVKKIVATTQMQATYARKAFPCFDEPAMKAVFDITLIHPPGTIALANSRDAEILHTSLDETDVLVTRFEPTKRMSTYILAFIVSDFGSIQKDETDSTTLVRIWARKTALESGHGDYALNVTLRVLEFFERYYNTSYPLTKSDQVALPDFNAGAMENWGLITYRETSLLYDPKTSSNGNKERVLTVIAHELAHMWFGNLVTLRWWNDLWLNEGFASYVEYLGADHAEPSWHIKDMIVQGDVQRAFAADSLVSSHPLTRSENEVSKPEEISQMFDTISYSKGAAVLRMLSEFLSEPVFVKGLSSYLHQFAFGNTVYSDLWDHLQDAAQSTGLHVNLPYSVHDIMNRWILQMGFPLVTIDTTTGTISQKHFLLDPDAVVDRPSIYNYQWIVPIKWMKNGVHQDQHWLIEKTAVFAPMRASGSQWILANLNVSGYYRVNYDQQNWERLFAQLSSDHQVIPIINRAQIIDDAFSLVKARILNTTMALQTTKYLVQEREYMPWEAASRSLNYFFQMFDRTEVYGPMLTYLRRLVQPLYDHFQSDQPLSHTMAYTKGIAVSLACKTGVPGCKQQVLDQFRQWMREPHNNRIDPNLKWVVYCHAIAAGAEAEWNFGWEMLQNVTMASEAARLRSALGCTKLPWLLNRYLEYSLDPSKIRKQDAASTIGYVASNVVGQSFAWDFFRSKWDYLFKEFGGGSFVFPSLITSVTRRFSTEFELQQLLDFQRDHPDLGSGKVALDQAIEKTRANIKWMAENKKAVLDWFNSQSAS